MTKRTIHKVLDDIDQELLSKRGSASLSSARSNATPATKANQDIGKRKEQSEGEIEPEGGKEGRQHTEGVKVHPKATPSKACPHCGR